MGARMILKSWPRGSWRLHSDKAREAGEFVDQFAVAVGPALR
jgi:hypothetical protein